MTDITKKIRRVGLAADAKEISMSKKKIFLKIYVYKALNKIKSK